MELNIDYVLLIGATAYRCPPRVTYGLTTVYKVLLGGIAYSLAALGSPTPDVPFGQGIVANR